MIGQLILGIALGLSIMVGGAFLWWRSRGLSNLMILPDRHLWQSTTDGFLIVSQDGMVLEANKVAGEMLGSTLEGQSLTAVLPDPNAYIIHTLPLHNWRKQAQGQLIILAKRPLPPIPLPPPDPPQPPPTATDTYSTSISQDIPYKVLRTISELLEPEAVAYIAVQAIADLTDWRTIAIYTPDDDDKLVIRAAVGIPFTDEGVIGRVFRTGHLQIMSDTTTSSSYLTPSSLSPSALVIPLRRGRTQLGVLAIEHEQPNAFSNNDIIIAEALADAVVLTLDNARLFREAQNRLTEQSVLREAMSIISSTLELNSVLYHLAEQMGRLLQVTSVYIYNYNAQQNRTTVLAEYYGNRASESERVSDLGSVYYLSENFPDSIPLLEKGEPILAYVDDPELSAVKRQHLQTFNSYTSLIIPLQVGGKTIAYAEIWESQQRRTFTSAEIQLCQDIAHHAAIAIENARLFKVITDERGRLQALIESDRDGIILVGGNGRILVMNEPAHHFLQFDKQLDDWINISTKEAITYLSQKTPHIAQIALAEHKRLVKGDTQPMEGEFDLPNRSIHWRSLPVIGEGETTSRLIVLRDITQERLVEKMRDDLIHTMVHDLRSPLASISITFDLLNLYMGKVKDEKVNRTLNRARASAGHMLTIVNAILDISQLESDQVQLAYNTVTFASIINTVIDLQTPLTLEKQLQLIRNIPPDLPHIQVDAALIERVLQNLIGNAIKFTPAGGTVEVKAEVHAQQLLVSVRDTGAGIPKEVQGRLFQKFSIGNQPERGSGLGLVFCKMAIEAHKQRIWLAETSAEGTTFKFTLPLADSDDS